MVLCRLTAPLVKTCLDLIRNRVHARVRGRDLGKSLGKLIRTIEKMDGYTWAAFPAYLSRYAQVQTAHFRSIGASEARIETLKLHQAQAILACYEGANAYSASELSVYIEGLFDDGKPNVLLSTVHRAKGLENGSRVYPQA